MSDFGTTSVLFHVHRRFCTFLMLHILPVCRLFRFSFRHKISQMAFPLGFSLLCLRIEIFQKLCLIQVVFGNYLRLLLSMLLLVHIPGLSSVCNALLCTGQVMLLWGRCCLPSLRLFILFPFRVYEKAYFYLVVVCPE